MWANNTSLYTKSADEIKFIAHRGLAQNFDISKVESDTNTSAMIYEPEYPYIENTIESMQIACFHDYTLEYHANGTDEISDYTMDELRLLDIGYGYTADGAYILSYGGDVFSLTTISEQY